MSIVLEKYTAVMTDVEKLEPGTYVRQPFCSGRGPTMRTYVHILVLKRYLFTKLAASYQGVSRCLEGQQFTLRMHQHYSSRPNGRLLAILVCQFLLYAPSIIFIVSVHLLMHSTSSLFSLHSPVCLFMQLLFVMRCCQL